jgi:hypothetical protein
MSSGAKQQCDRTLGALPLAVRAFEVAAAATDDDDAPNDQLSEFEWVCR